MTALPRKRRKMLIRLIILFSALVTVPLAVSGALLSIIGRSSVLRVGNDVTTTGAQRMHESSGRLIDLATSSFNRSASHLIDLSRRELENSQRQHAQMSVNTLQQLSSGLRECGDATLREAIGQMAQESRRIITESNVLLKARQTGAVNKLLDALTDNVRAVFRRTAQQLTEQNRQKMQELIADLNAARAQIIGDHARAQVMEVHSTFTAIAQSRLALLSGPEPPPNLLPPFNVDGAKPPPPGPMSRRPRPRLFGRLDAFVDGAFVLANGVVVSTKGSYASPQDFLNEQEFPSHVQAFNEAQKNRRLYVSPVVFSDEEPVRPMMTMASPVFDEQRREMVGVLIADVSLGGLSGMVLPRAMRPGGARADGNPATAFIVQENGLVIAHSDRRRVGKEVDPAYQDVVRQAFREKRETGTLVLGKTAEEQRVVSWYRIAPIPDVNWLVISTQPIADVAVFAERMNQAIEVAAHAAVQDTEKKMLHITQTAMTEFAREREQLLNQAEEKIRRVSTSALNKRLKALKDDEERAIRAATDAVQKHGQQMQDTLQRLEANLRRATQQEARHMRDKAEPLVQQNVRDIRRHIAKMSNQSAQRMLQNSLMLIALFLVLAMGLAAATAKSIVTPIEQLLDGTTALAAGDYAKRVPVKSDDEMGLLAAAFNQMAEAVERSSTELERTNNRLMEEKTRIQHIIEGLPDGVMMVDHRSEVVFLNSAVRFMLGLDGTPRDSDSRTLSLDAPALQPFAERIEAALREPQDVTLEQPRRRVLRLRAVPIKDDVGQPGCLLLLHDVTQEREIDEMKNSFIALVSHELRTPLTSILAFSSYLLTEKLGPLTDAQRTGVESMYRQAKRLSAIISDFLDVSRIESGKVQMRKQLVEVDQIAERVIEELRPQAAEKNITMSIEKQGMAEDAPVVALADEQRIAQVFTNLLGNALKFTDANGKVNITLSMQNDSVVVSVSDTGCGIPPEELPKIFDRFYQVERVVTRKTGGTGLGLAIVKNIVEAHGGKVWVTSQVGEGTTFSFTLPR
ncbi:MAG: ATP-binding protein [Abditibacteriales bacterium]|nr:ATP-binding protein [Abditibacteriales bacterium]MDW8364241.1 ATP-binding protein [Abditibacteriales bacterium]